MSRTGPSGRSDAFGFTFLELLVVLVILGMFGALVSVRIQDVFSRGDLRLASRIVMGEVKRFRGRAAYTHEAQVMVMEIGRNVLYAEEKEPSKGPSTSATLDLDTGDESVRQETLLPDGVVFEDVVTAEEGKMQDEAARVRFFADGTVEKALIHLRNHEDEFYTLEINPLTGYVTAYDRYVDQEDQGR